MGRTFQHRIVIIKNKKGPHPKRDKVAVVACMNKTVKCLLAMVKANQVYDYSYHGLKVQ